MYWRQKQHQAAQPQRRAGVWSYSNAAMQTIEWRWLCVEENVGADGFLSREAALRDAEQHGYRVAEEADDATT